MDIRGKKVLVVGLARSGLAAARWLSDHGAVVTVTDLRSPSAFPKEIPELLNCKVGLELGVHQESTFLRHDFIVISPGVRADLPVLNLARQEGIPVVPEVEVAGWFLEGRLVGITGTNGKTTATSLLGKILVASGFSTFVGGNIGVPLLAAVDQDPPASIVVSELSSFQLETVDRFRPHVAVLLNLSPNHLDRHPSFDAYIAAKARIFRNQTPDDYAILNADDDNVMKLAPSIRSRKILFSRRKELANGVFISHGTVLYRVQNLEVALLRQSDVRLRGEFNLENVLAASAAACALGAEFSSIRRAVREFAGVEHRLEFVRDIRGVDFYNDSKATSVDAAAKALSTFESGVHLILGGKDKGAPYAPLRSLMKDRVREVLVIGSAQQKIVSELSGAAEIVEAGDLETALRTAASRAVPGDVVLLAPACSSFDQFEDFEHRGRVFKDLVGRLAEENRGRSKSRGSHTTPEVRVPVARTVNEPASYIQEHLDTPGPEGSPMERALDQDHAQPPASQPEPSVLTPPPELEYVYEVSVEETRRQSNSEFVDDADECLVDEDDLAIPDEIDDEPLAYEIRAGSVPVRRDSGAGRVAFSEIDIRKHRSAHKENGG